MGNDVRISELMERISAFCKERDWDRYHNPKDLAIGMSTESNELLDMFRFISEEESWSRMEDGCFREHACEEVIDVLWFVLRFAERNDIDLEEAFDRKIAKNAEKYPR